MNKELVDLIKEEFDAILMTKTGWGRNEIKAALDQAIYKAALKLLDKK